MVGNAASNRSYPMVGVKSGWHQISHHRNDPKMVSDLQKIDQYHVEQFVYFLNKLRKIREGDGCRLGNFGLLVQR